MKDFEEKLLKRWLKRKVKITLATIVAFLIGSSLSLAESLYIQDGANGVEFSVDGQNWGENPYPENSFENGIYTNNITLEDDSIGIYNQSLNISLINNGKISISNNENGYGIENNGTIENLVNNGIILSNKETILGSNNTNNIVNNGLLIGDSKDFVDNGGKNNGIIFDIVGERSYNIQEYIDTGSTGISENGKTIINAKLVNNNPNDTQSIILSNMNNSNMIYNGITNTVMMRQKNSLIDSIVNGYTIAIVFSAAVENEATLNNSVINGIRDYAIYGGSKKDNLILENNTIINGKIFLGDGDDILSLENTVQINGDFGGGAGTDELIFNSSNIELNKEKNLNIFNKVHSFENINIGTNVTFFEEAKITEAKNINIVDGGNLNLIVNGTEKDNKGNIIGHALYDNEGSIKITEGKLNLEIFNLGKKGIIDFNKNDLSNINIDDIGISSALHEGEIEGNTIIISIKNDLDELDIKNYDKLNKIYQSVINSNNLDEIIVYKEQYKYFLEYIHDIYAGSPYSFSSQLSRKSANMFSDIVMGKDLHPEVNKWAIHGGLTHIDGGTKDTYYGKGYYTYDVGSKDIDVDSKITGMYAQGEYGVNETLNLGVIFGGNQSESEINGNSKVEGDSFYLGAYAKKYLGNLRLLAGVGYQYGDYKADRVAVGYDGITTTRTYDSNYNDNTFNIYAQAKYSNKLAENLYLEPSVALDYTYVSQDGASEDGVLAIETDDKDFNYTTAKFGVDLRKDIPTASATHSLVAGAYYNRMLDGYEEENITGRFVGGSDFDILVSPSNKHELGLRAKYEVELNNGVTFDVKGSYTFARESYSGDNKNKHKGEWLVGIGLGYKF